jgi:predicted nucleic acid-binding protein
MTALVLDASVAIAWCFPAQKDAYCKAVLTAVSEGLAVVPVLWAIEVGNVLLTSERRGMLTVAMARAFLDDLAILPKQVDVQQPERAFGDVLELARKHKLTNYDACYLELAKRMGLPMASLDADLKAAAKREGVVLFKAG